MQRRYESQTNPYSPFDNSPRSRYNPALNL